MTAWSLGLHSTSEWVGELLVLLLSEFAVCAADRLQAPGIAFHHAAYWSQWSDLDKVVSSAI